MTLRGNSAWVTVGGFARVGVLLVSVPVLLRTLGTDRYGAWAVISSVVALCSLAELGIGTALTNQVAGASARQEWSRVRQVASDALFLLTALGALSAVGLFVLSPALTSRMFADATRGAEAAQALKVLCWVVPLRFWQQWTSSIQAGMFRYDLQTMVETASTVILQAGAALLALAGCDLSGLAKWLVCGTGAAVLAQIVISRRFGLLPEPVMSISKVGTAGLLRFGVAQWVSSLGSAMFGQADRIIVNGLLGLHAAGLYTAATTVAAKINELSALPLRVLPSAVRTVDAVNGRSATRPLLTWAMRVNGVGAFSLAIPIVIFALPISRVLAGESDSLETSSMLTLLALIYGLYSLNAAGFFMAIGLEHPAINARWALLGGTLTCCLLWLLAPRFGTTGAVWANAGYVLTLGTYYEVHRLMGSDSRGLLGALLLPSCSIAAWPVAFYLLRSIGLSFLITTILAACLAAAGVLMLGGVSCLRRLDATGVRLPEHQLAPTDLC